MGEIQRKHERAISEAFICWFNARDGKRFRCDSRPHEAPDQRYVDGDEILNIEITDAYYDKGDAAMEWSAARKEDDAPTHWMGGNVDRTLVANVSGIIAKKCRNDYGRDCVLVVDVRSPYRVHDPLDGGSLAFRTWRSFGLRIPRLSVEKSGISQ